MIYKTLHRKLSTNPTKNQSELGKVTVVTPVMLLLNAMNFI